MEQCMIFRGSYYRASLVRENRSVGELSCDENELGWIDKVAVSPYCVPNSTLKWFVRHIIARLCPQTWVPRSWQTWKALLVLAL